jgi:hypothetical protein
MPRNGSGVYGPPAGTAAVPNTTIESADYNAVVADMAQAHTDSINVHGTAPFQANQPMGGNKLTGLSAGAAAGDSVNVGQVQSDIVAHASAVGGTADAITATFSPAFTTYTAKMRFRFTAGAANTNTAPTINIDGLGAKTIKKLNGAALAVADIAGSGHVCDCVYNGTDVILLNFAPVAVDREQTFTAKQTFTRPLIVSLDTLTDAATIAWDMAVRPNDVKVLLSASRNLGAAANLIENQKGRLIIIQDGTGGWALTPNAAYKQPGGQTILDLDKTANSRTIYEYQVVKNSGGTNEVWIKRLWSENKTSMGFYREYSPGNLGASAHQFTIAHGLGRYPAFALLFFECIVADTPFAIGHRVFVPYGSVVDTGSGGANTGCGVSFDTTNIYVSSNSVYFYNFVTSAFDELAAGRWKFIVRVFE